MVHQCQADHCVLQHAQALLQQGAEPEVGLLVGRFGVSCDFLLCLVETPNQDDSSATGGSDSSSRKGSVRLSNEWISEHAAQVAHMLPGGISIIGAYLVAGDAEFAATVPKLCALAKALSANVGDDSLLLHIAAASGKLVLKRYAASAPSNIAGLKPVELRLTAVQSAFQMLRCSADIDMMAPVPKGGATLCNRFSSLLAQQAARFEAGVALCGGRLLDSALPLADALPQRADPSDVQRIELLCPPACAAAQAAASTSTTAGRIRIAGRLEGFAFMPRRELLSTAIETLQADLAASLHRRLELVEEDAESMAAEDGLDSHPLLARPSAVAIVAPALPARVFLRTQLEAESLVDVTARARELLGSHLIAAGTVPAPAEEGRRLLPPDMPWAPLQEQDTAEPVSPKRPGVFDRLPWFVMLLLWMAVGIAASLAALPVSAWILQSEYLSSRP